MPILRRLALLAPLLAAPLPALATEQAGVSAAVRGEVALTRAQVAQGRQVVGGEPILMQDSIRSGVRSGAQILLLDQTVFTIGPESEVVVDDFVYDPQTNAGRMSARVAQGVFRFVSGKMAKEHPQDVTVKLPTGTLGIRGTLVAGRVDEATKRAFLVLLGEGRENDTGSLAGAIDVCNAGTCVSVRTAGFGTRIEGPGAAPLEPYRVPVEEINELTQSVSDPAGWLGRSEGGGLPAVSAGAEGGDVRSPTDVSGRSDVASDPSTLRALQRLREIAGLDTETTFASQDSRQTVETPSGAEVPAGGGFLPDLTTFPGPGQLTTYADLATLAATGVQTAVFTQSGIGLTDLGSYDFSMTLDLGARSVAVEIDNINSPSLDLHGESLRHTQSFDTPGFENLAFLRQSGRLSGGEGPCSGGCDSFVQAYVFSRNGRVADSVLQSLAIVPEHAAAPPVFTADPYQPITR